MAAFVYVGEYSTGCACELQRTSEAGTTRGVGVAGAVIPAAVAVMTQMREAQRRQVQQYRYQPFAYPRR